MNSTYKVLKINALILCLCLIILWAPHTAAQQFFVKDFDISSAIGQLPDFRASGTHVTHDPATGERGVLVYGNIAYSENELTASEGGFGQTDIVILHNNLEGINQWALTFGTNKKDVVTRVVMDSEGNLALAGYTVIAQEKKVFIAKIDMSVPTVAWANIYNSGVPSDFINVYADGSNGGNSEGYAACGIAGDQSFIIHTDLNGSVTSPGHWAHYYPNLNFRSIIQLKGPGLFVGSGLVYGSNFVVAGSLNGSGYAGRVDATNGSVDEDLDMIYSDFSPCDISSPRVSTYVSLDQDQHANISLLGTSSNGMHLTRITSNFKVVWDQRMIEDDAEPHDLNATSFGYLAIFERPASGSQIPLEVAQYDFDGNIKGVFSLTSAWDWHLSSEPSSNNLNQLPQLDFDMECGKALHFSGTEEICSNPPANWAIDRIPHARWRVHADNCMSEEVTFDNEKCLLNVEWQPGVQGYKEGSISPTPFSPEIAEISPSSDTYCEASCPANACVDISYITGEAGTTIGLYALGGGDFEWSTGSTSNQITVRITKKIKIYTLDRIDGNGCVTTVVYYVFDGSGKKESGENVETTKVDSPQELSFYPNPSQGIIKVEIPADGISLEIFDTQGRLLEKIDDLSTGEHSIDLTAHPAGLYLIKAIGDNLHKSLFISKE